MGVVGAGCGGNLQQVSHQPRLIAPLSREGTVRGRHNLRGYTHGCLTSTFAQIQSKDLIIIYDLSKLTVCDSTTFPTFVVLFW